MNTNDRRFESIGCIAIGVLMTAISTYLFLEAMGII